MQYRSSVLTYIAKGQGPRAKAQIVVVIRHHHFCMSQQVNRGFPDYVWVWTSPKKHTLSIQRSPAVTGCNELRPKA